VIGKWLDLCRGLEKLTFRKGGEMIIDVHFHLIIEDWLPEAWWNGVARIYVHGLKAMGIDMTSEAVRQTIFGSFWDPDGEALIREMDAAGIDKTVILPSVDWGIAMGEPKVSYEEQNKAYAEVQRRHPDRIIAFAGVDPRRPNAIKFVETAIKEWGLKGLKLHPGSGFYPNGRESYRLLKRVCELGVPVLCHTGQWPLYDKYCDPVYLDDILVDFPNLTVIAAHLAEGWHNTLFAMATYKPNLATDFSRWQAAARNHYHYFCEHLRRALDCFGSDRVLFGTDGPYFRAIMTDKDWVQLIKDLPQKAPDGITFTQAEVEAMLGGNAARILGISG